MLNSLQYIDIHNNYHISKDLQAKFSSNENEVAKPSCAQNQWEF
jgi:hypothetical protein